MGVLVVFAGERVGLHPRQGEDLGWGQIRLGVLGVGHVPTLL